MGATSRYSDSQMAEAMAFTAAAPMKTIAMTTIGPGLPLTELAGMTNAAPPMPAMPVSNPKMMPSLLLSSVSPVIAVDRPTAPNSHVPTPKTA